MLSAAAARALLVLHTAAGVAAVAAGTHLVIWLRRYLRGQLGRRRAVLKFAWLFFALQLGAFAAGNAMYPTYRVEVRAAYLENADEIRAGQVAHDGALARLDLHEGEAAEAPTAISALVARAADAVRWFDVKEHWVALGLFASAAALLILALWRPGDDPSGDAARALGPLVLGLAAVACATTWLAAIVGVLTAAWRAV